jgi:serine/threonine-protein phosphatase 2A regulatory subunit A
LLTDEERVEHIVPVVKHSAEDKSWRVRYCAAEKISSLATAFGPQITNFELIPLFVRLLKDTEAEVRGAAAAHVSDMAQGGDSNPLPVDVIFEQILPCVEELVHDNSQHVRTSLASAIMGLAPLVGHEGTISKLVPLFLVLLQDEIPEVRLNVVSKIGEVNSVVGIQVLSERLLPAIVSLARYRMWRVRHAVLEHIPTLAVQLGAETFSNRATTQDSHGMSLLELCIEWLHDEVHTIRAAAANNLKLLAEAFGAEWATLHLVPQVASMCASTNYLYRLTTLSCCAKLAEVLVNSPSGLAQLVEMVMGMAQDPVPNVRFNVSKAIVQMAPFIEQSMQGQGAAEVGTRVKPMLQTMCDDPDADVKFFATQALQEIA